MFITFVILKSSFGLLDWRKLIIFVTSLLKAMAPIFERKNLEMNFVDLIVRLLEGKLLKIQLKVDFVLNNKLEVIYSKNIIFLFHRIKKTINLYAIIANSVHASKSIHKSNLSFKLFSCYWFRSIKDKKSIKRLICTCSIFVARTPRLQTISWFSTKVRTFTFPAQVTWKYLKFSFCNYIYCFVIKIICIIIQIILIWWFERIILLIK